MSNLRQPLLTLLAMGANALAGYVLIGSAPDRFHQVQAQTLTAPAYAAAEGRSRRRG